jgi:hypothetical protein
MSILDNQLQKSKFGLKGIKPNTMPGASRASTLHNTSSINNIPPIEEKPSELDLNGKKPEEYVKNLPR